MKKITSLLMLSLAFAGTAWAQTPEGNKLPKGTWSVEASTSTNQESGAGNGVAAAIIDGNSQTFWHSNYGTGTGFNQGGNCPHYFVIDMKQSVNVTGFSYTPRQHSPAANGTCKSYEFYVSDTPFSNVKAPAANKSEVDAYNTGLANADATGTMEENTQEKVVALSKAKQGRYVLFVIKDAKGSFGNCAEFDVYSTTSIVEKKAQVTYTYKLGNATKTQTVEQIVGTNYAAPAIDFVTFTQPEGKVKEGANNVTVTCTEALPFEKTTDLNNPKWSTINMHNYNNYSYQLFWNYVADSQDIKATKQNYNYEILKDDAYLWCFYGNAFDGFEIYNKKATTSKSLNATDGNAQITEGAHTKWFIVNSGEDSGKPCFTSDHTNYLNAQFDKGSQTIATLKYWTSPDGGSTCRVFAPAHWVLTKAEDVINIPNNAVGGYLNDEFLDNQYTEYEKDLFNITNAIALGDAIKNLQSNGITIEAGAYYRLQNVQRKSALSANSTKAVPGKISNSDINGLWQFVAGEGENTYKLFNPNHKNNLPAPNKIGDGFNEGAEYTLNDLTDAQFNLKVGNNNLVDYGNGNIGSWSDNPKNSDGAWYLVKATDIEVDLASANDGAYATTYLPFGVSGVEGATAFIGKKNGDQLNMTSVNAFPAETGVVLKGEKDAEKAVLTIGEATAVEGNELQGTLLGKAYENELVLGISGGQIGFYSLNDGATIGANKAFLPAVAQGAQSFVLNFDGEATAIESVMGKTNTDAPVYDLSGRRVVKTVKGGLYIQNGKKFIVR